MAEAADPSEPVPGRVAERAERYFREAHNCAMAVLRAVTETQAISCPECIPGVALGMGGGVGHTGHACGALTGAVMAIGLAVDRFLPGSLKARKDEAHVLAAGLINHFCDAFGAADCRALLGFEWSEPDARERWRRDARDKCEGYVRWCAAEALRIAESLRGAGA